MKTLYNASNALEAHMLVDLLKQEGLQAQVLGEYLQGAVGELPAGGLVRIVVEDEHHGAARELIQRWEAAQPIDRASGPSLPSLGRSGSGGAWIFAAGVLVGMVAMYALSRA